MEGGVLHNADNFSFFFFACCFCSGMGSFARLTPLIGVMLFDLAFNWPPFSGCNGCERSADITNEEKDVTMGTCYLMN